MADHSVTLPPDRPFGPSALAILWLLLLVLAFFADYPVARHIMLHPPFDKRDAIVTVVKWPGNFLFTLAIAAALALFHRDGRRAAVQLILAAAIGGLVYSLVKWVVGRHRPARYSSPFFIHPFIGGISGLWRADNLSFPSGHACLSFATAMSLTMFLPRWRWLFFLGAILVGFERIGENAHYVSDVVAGAACGIFSAGLAARIVAQYHPQ